MARKRSRKSIGIILEMTGSSQSQHDRILWVLANNGGKMERSRLRARTQMKYATLDLILAELVREGKIKIDSMNMVSLKRY